MLQIDEVVCESGWERYDHLYEFPGPFSPRADQRLRFNFLLNHANAFDFSDMGSGKSITSLWAADYLIQNCGGSVLILAPLSTLYTVWGKTCALIYGNSKQYMVLINSLSCRSQRVRANSANVYVSNYECTNSRDFRCAVLESSIHTLVIDECDSFANPTTDKSKHLREIGHGRNVWGLSATPMAESPMGAH